MKGGMNCSHCGSDNPAGKNFCGGCGAALENRCPHCGADNPPNKKFCGDCGASFAAQLARATDKAEARKVVTIIFADLIGSTSLHERLDAESVTRLMERYYRAMRGAVEAHGGAIVKLMGDGVMAAFGVPRVAEDDAIRAVRAGIAMQEAMKGLRGSGFGVTGGKDVETSGPLTPNPQPPNPLGLRVGINTGEVVVSADNTDVVGDPVNVAARLQTEAHEGEVVISESTRRLVAALVTLAPLGSFALKGRAAAMKAYRVESLDRPVAATAAAFVGRDDELARISAVYEAALATPAARLAVLLGSPGLGKSRLIEEVTRQLADRPNVVTAHCEAAGGATFAPLAAGLREFFEIEAGASLEAAQAVIEAAIPVADNERTRIAGGIASLLAGSPASPEETFFVIRRLLAGLAAARPVVLVIDDLQWAEPLLLDLVEHLVQWGSGTPLLVLVGARPELRDLRSSLATPGGFVAAVVTLSGLDAGAAMRLAANVIGAADLPTAVAAKVLATSEGNPLFVGELVRMLVDEGAIERQGERWIVGANLATLEMPPTLHALLAARIERLGPEDRAVLERASVVGRHFSRSAVAALLGRNGRELNTRIEALQRTELIERDTGWFLGEPVLRFHHVLIRDAAYRRLLKGTRAELHEHLADWIEAQVKDAPEHDETIGWHLEQAHQLLRELGLSAAGPGPQAGPLDAKGKTLGERAAARLAAAGRRSLARDDLPVAADLLGRAIDRLDSNDPVRAELALDWCEALLAAGDVAAAANAIAELARFAGATDRSDPRLRAWHTCFTGQLTVLTAPQALHTTAGAVAAAADELAKLGDAAGEATGYFVHALALSRLGKGGACEAALDRALAASRRTDDRRRANSMLAVAPRAALWGPSPVTRASGRCLDVVRVLRITQGAPAVEAVALSYQAVLEALRGRTDASRRMIASARKLVEDLGITQRLLEVDVLGGLIDLLEGDAAAAERNLRRAYDGLRDLGLGIDAARAAALLARALLAQDRGAEAEALSHDSEALAGDDLKAAIAWRCVRAEALARRGEHTPAIGLANEAVEIAAATDALLDHADARLALAEALRAVGRGAEADAAERRAIELWEAKGATLLADGARRRGTSEPENDRPPLPRRDHREVAPPDGPPPGPHLAKEGNPSRRVQPNAATAMLARLHAHLAARNFDAVTELSREDMQSIGHPSGSSYGREAIVASLRLLFRSRDPHFECEPLATLGDFLVLARRRTSASGGGGRYDVGVYQNDALELVEVDESGKVSRTEVFAADKLGAAVARLYERYAEMLPEGPACDRAVTTAHTVAFMLTRSLDHRPEDVMAPDLEAVDHSSVGNISARGGEYVSRWFGAWEELAEDRTSHVEEVLALSADALLRRSTTSGTVRASGGAFESSFLALSVFGPDGRQTRIETFDVGHEAQALARFDDVVAGAGPQRTVRRRLTPNAATENIGRFDAATAARDLDALARNLCDEVEVVHHKTAATYGRKAFLTTWRSLFNANKMIRQPEAIASLGDALALAHHTILLEGFAEDHLAAVGTVEIDEVVLFEVDDRGRARRIEIFATEKLGAAVARLYERFSELLPDGPQRERAAATARSLAGWNGPDDPDRLAATVTPSMEMVDHRNLGTRSTRGAEFLDHARLQTEIAIDFTGRTDGVLALAPDALLVRCTYFGIARDSGGAFENVLLQLFAFGADGLIARGELWEPDHEAEALARFDELSGGDTDAAADWFENAAARSMERL